MAEENKRPLFDGLDETALKQPVGPRKGSVENLRQWETLIRPLAVFCSGLAVLSIFWPDWIEALTGFDPDQHNGTVEWLIVKALLSTVPYCRSRRRTPIDAADDGV